MKRKRRNLTSHNIKKEIKSNSLTNLKKSWAIYPITAFLFIVLTAAVSIFLLSRNLPSLSELEKYDPELVSKIYSADGVELKPFALRNRIRVPLDRMPDHLINALIATEDRKFWRHWGIDLKRSVKMIFVNLASMEIQGGASTITQQLARKLYLTPKRSIIRKLREQLTAIQIERTYSKPEILEMYLNQMPLGRGAYGVQTAAMRYFGKNVEELQPHESALLVGLLQLPYGYFNPDRDTVAAKKRRNVVFRSMLDCNYITKSEYDSLCQLNLGVLPRDHKEDIIAPYFREYVRKMLYEKYGDRLFTGGLTIETTLDTRVQACADSAIKSFIPVLEKQIRERVLENKSFAKWLDPPLEDEEEIEKFLADSARVDSLMRVKYTLQVALIAIDPTNGHILAMVGGRDFKKSKFNRAVQMTRQPGSAFKPFAYTVAIENGYSPITELLNVPIVIPSLDGTMWKPKNYDGSVGGKTTLREGLKRSLNLIAAHLVQELIPAREVVKMAKRFGLTTKIHAYDGVALGQDLVIPIEITSAYSAFANKGVRVDPVAVLRVTDKDGNILQRAKPPSGRSHVVINENTAYIMTDMLQEVLKEGGTGFSARWKYKFYRPAAGKTGTTNDFKNGWFVGFTPQMTTCVWVGFDDERISLGDNLPGAKTALPVWARFMKMAHDTLNLPLADFEKPPGIIICEICTQSKKIATEACPKTITEVFTEKTVPTDTCDIHISPIEKRKRWKKKRIIF